MEWKCKTRIANGAVEAVPLEYDIEDAEGTNSASRAAAPALRHRKESTRRYTVVSAAGAWDVMEKARVSRTNLRQALRLRDDAAELGCADRQADRWIESRNIFYFERMAALFTQLDHWNLVADPGTHSYREVMPAALYGWNLDMVGFCPFQRLLSANAGVVHLSTPSWTQQSFPMCKR